MPNTKTRNEVATARSFYVTTSENAVNAEVEGLFINQLKDIYWAEKQLTRVFPRLEKAALAAQLKSAISDHAAQTVEHVKRIERMFSWLNKKPLGKKCEAMEGLVNEADRVIDETREGSLTRDAGIIVSAQKIEHYEIAAYSNLVQLALSIGENKAAELLQQTLEEERLADERLSSIAANTINHHTAELEIYQEVVEE